jgi:hypothetical protein
MPWSSAGQLVSALSTVTTTLRASAMFGFSTIAGHRFGDYKNAFRFGQLGYDLVEKRGLKRFQAATYAVRKHHAMDETSPGLL